ncbi:MAG: bifunctional oligoribonuclease/PAP phosphatase NrnA [Treponema sp.]|nr:bifunctional oligoribonuclease/PAP phosphatase NrnA [Treponema sp.]
MITEQEFNSFKNFINNHNFFIVIGHKEPDGDCISSCLGIAEILKHYNKQYQLLSAGPFKRTEIQKFEKQFTNEMEFLSESERKQTGLIICDCSEMHRLGEIEGDLRNLDTFVIDHHKTAEIPNNAESIIYSNSPAASLLVQLLYENCVGKLTEKIAKILYFGLMTDTGFFRFLTNKDTETFLASARLVEAGANPRETYDEITSGKSYQSRKLLGVMLNHAETYLDGKLIVTYETLEDTKKYGQEGRDSDALYSALLAVKNVEAVVFVRQETDSNCTAGFRSKDRVDVSSVAAKFGGGGHKNASGLSTQGKIETLIPAIVKEFARII